MSAPDGLAWQRTQLAWRRTVLAAGVVALLAVRLAVYRGADPARLVIAAATLAGWSALVVLANRRSRAAERPPSRAALLRVAALVVGYGAIGATLVILL
ncbi:DUF202 domain-containing protein [Rhizomonospora bruguierae]|uniref:DUF202 domain-containing protein n=1 Tax=Rhizomonospora bruguierae TaxID=1581705 RepID=UPI001BCB943F|nr:DUF202 domain-containing protein [Micromonospora sp. NBRC 107566]